MELVYLDLGIKKILHHCGYILKLGSQLYKIYKIYLKIINLGL